MCKEPEDDDVTETTIQPNLPAPVRDASATLFAHAVAVAGAEHDAQKEVLKKERDELVTEKEVLAADKEELEEQLEGSRHDQEYLRETLSDMESEKQELLSNIAETPVPSALKRCQCCLHPLEDDGTYVFDGCGKVRCTSCTSPHHPLTKMS